MFQPVSELVFPIRNRRAIEGSPALSAVLSAPKSADTVMINTTYGHFASQLSEALYEAFEDMDVVRSVISCPSICPHGRHDTILRREQMLDMLEQLREVTKVYFLGPVGLEKTECAASARFCLEKLTQHLVAQGCRDVAVGALRNWLQESSRDGQNNFTDKQILEVIAELGIRQGRQDWSWGIAPDSSEIEQRILAERLSFADLDLLPELYAEIQVALHECEAHVRHRKFMGRIEGFLFVTHELRSEIEGKFPVRRENN